jgi:hypothetical protein
LNRKTKKTNSKDKEDDIAYLGNHVDFSINNSTVDVFYNAHWTEYHERNDETNTFERRANYICTFLTASEKNIGKTQCVDQNNAPLFLLDRVFTDKSQQDVIKDLWKASNGLHVPHQKGGIPIERRGYKSYKGITTMCTQFYEFMNLTIFSQLWNKMRHTPLNVYQYFDEGNDLDPLGNKSVQYVIEFDEGRTLAIAVSSHRALKACWTADAANKDVASIREKRALNHWHLECARLLATDFYI